MSLLRIRLLYVLLTVALFASIGPCSSLARRSVAHLTEPEVVGIASSKWYSIPEDGDKVVPNSVNNTLRVVWTAANTPGDRDQDGMCGCLLNASEVDGVNYGTCESSAVMSTIWLLSPSMAFSVETKLSAGSCSLVSNARLLTTGWQYLALRRGETIIAKTLVYVAETSSISDHALVSQSIGCTKQSLSNSGHNLRPPPVTSLSLALAAGSGVTIFQSPWSVEGIVFMLTYSPETNLPGRLHALVSFGPAVDDIASGDWVEIYMDDRLVTSHPTNNDTTWSIPLPPSSQMFGVGVTLSDGLRLAAVLVNATHQRCVLLDDKLSKPRTQIIDTPTEDLSSEPPPPPISERELLLPHCDETSDYSQGEWVVDEDYMNYAFPEITSMQSSPLDATHYRWRGDKCRLDRFDPVDMCQVLNGRSMLFLGDSLARERFYAMTSLMGVKAKSMPYPEADWAEGAPTQVTVCNGRTVLRFLLAGQCRSRPPGNFTRNGNTFFVDKPLPFSYWSDYIDIARDFDIVLLSCVAHMGVQPMSVIAKVYTEAADDLVDYGNGVRPYFLTQPIGHPGCGHDMKPLERGQDKDVVFDEKARQYGWDIFPAVNSLAKESFGRRGIRIVDGAPALGLRQDLHHVTNIHGADDCLHYRLPGPPDFYPTVMYSILRAEEERGDAPITKPKPRARPAEFYFNRDWLLHQKILKT